MKKVFKKTIISLIILFAVFLILAILFLDFSKDDVAWGVTFSSQYAEEELGLDWQETYLAILDDLQVDRIRLSAYWNQIESIKGSYDFSRLDWQVEQATNRDLKIVLAVGRKLPRWPECHDPGWISNISQQDIQARQLDFISETVNRYRQNGNIIIWQVENEPFLKMFGECPPLDEDFLTKEVELVKSLDYRPVMVTDSGELNSWLNAGSVGGEILGTTLYRVVYNKWFGYVRWFLPPSFYYFKSLLVKWFTPTSRVLVAELQAEAWHIEGKTLPEMEIESQFESLSPDQFRANISFARRAGFDEVYLWGAEWWYWLKSVANEEEIWNEAKMLWQ